MISCSAIEEGYWEISCPRTLGALARFRGKSEDVELQAVVKALGEILQAGETITDIKWFSDFSGLTDGYAKTAASKRFTVFTKYFEKMFLPLCWGGCLVALIGGITGGEKSVLIRIGTIMFLLPIVVFFGSIVVGLLWRLVSDIKKNYRERSKKKWLRWFAYLGVIAVLVVPFLLGLLDIESVDRVMPSIQRFVFGFMVLAMLCMVFFIFYCGISSEVKKQSGKIKKVLYIIGFTLLLVGFTGFFGGALSSLGVLKWVPNRIEFPLAHIGDMDIDRDGNLYVLSRFYGRVQVYDREGEFVGGWFYDAASGEVLIEINDKNEVEVAATAIDTIYVFDVNGELLKTNEYEEIDSWYSEADIKKHLFDELTGTQYDAKGLVFPRIIQKGTNGENKIGKNAFYLFPFQGAFQAVGMGMVGIIILNKIDKKQNKKK